jgi:hypothetical protein
MIFSLSTNLLDRHKKVKWLFSSRAVSDRDTLRQRNDGNNSRQFQLSFYAAFDLKGELLVF